LIRKVFKSGHLSIAEHITFTYGISGISRSCSHQLVRHRLCTFSQQSQRYTDLSKSKIDWIIPDSIYKDEYALAYYNEALKAIEKAYLYCVDIGIKAEDARFILPNACPTNITVTTNLRNLMHIMGLRLCSRAQWEIRQVFKEMQKQTVEQYPFLKDYLQPNCEQLGFCPEGHGACGRKPKKSELIKVYKESQKG
jgi:thymidylate synthase (FAD)